MAEHFDDPPRWSEDGSGAPSELRALLRDAERDLPSARELASLAARLEPELSPAPSPAPGSAPALAPRAARLLAPIGVLMLAGAGVLVARGLSSSDERITTPPPSAASAAIVPAPSRAPSPEPPAASPRPAAEPSSPAAPAVTSNAPARAPAAGSAARLGEAELLELARRALATDPARALRLTERHKQSFPKGVLQQEREVIAIEALRRLGRAGAASQRAGEFEQQFPDSAHRRGVEAGHGKP
jgi:hypothetical protein